MLLNEQVKAANTAIYNSQASQWYLSTLSTWSPNSMVDPINWKTFAWLATGVICSRGQIYPLWWMGS
jgi:hypothetical protein